MVMRFVSVVVVVLCRYCDNWVIFVWCLLVEWMLVLVVVIFWSSMSLCCWLLLIVVIVYWVFVYWFVVVCWLLLWGRIGVMILGLWLCFGMLDEEV